MVAAIVAAFLFHLQDWRFICDDAYISFRYARNLAEYGALVFNTAPLEYVEGYTNFLFVLLLTVGHKLGVAPPTLAPQLNMLAGLAILGLVTLVSRSLRLRFSARHETPAIGAFDLVPASVLVLVPEFVVWASSGLETSLAVALGLTAILAWLEGAPALAAAMAALAALTRPDALVWIGGFGLAWLCVAGVDALRGAGIRVHRWPWRRLLFATLVFVVPLLGHLLWRRSYYDAWLPNTWSVKSNGALLRDSWGLAYVEVWARNLHAILLCPLLLLTRPRHLLVLVPGALALLYAWSVGGDFMAYSRFLLPATVMLALWVGWTLSGLHALSRRHLGERVPTAALVWLLIVIGAAAQIPSRIGEDRAQAHLDGRWEGVLAMDRFARVRVAAGEIMGRELSSETWVTVGAAGAMPYASRLPVYDSYGLVDPGVAAATRPSRGRRSRPGHQLHGSMSYMRSRDPDLLCHVGTDSIRPARPADARRRGLAEWRWACFETGPIEDPHGATKVLESRFYCCLRPPDRPLVRIASPRASGGSIP